MSAPKHKQPAPQTLSTRKRPARGTHADAGSVELPEAMMQRGLAIRAEPQI